MRIGAREVRHISQLAEIAVDDDELPALVEQLDRIVEFVAQLEAGAAEPVIEPFVPGPPQVAWREDVVAPVPLAIPPAALAPAWREGYFVVPRLAAMEEP